MFIYKPENLAIEIKTNELIYVLPNIAVYKTLLSYGEGIPEVHLINWSLENLIQKEKVFIDIGAHIGTWSIKFGANKKISKVYSFEPQKDTYSALVAGVALNDLVDKITTYRLALGSPEQVGTQKLKLIIEDGGGSSICDLPTNINPKLGTMNVDVKTFDEVCGNVRNIGLIKIDVEGNELNVIKGALNTLEANSWPKIMFEAWMIDWYEPEKQKLFGFLIKLGYRIIPINNYPEEFLAERQ